MALTSMMWRKSSYSGSSGGQCVETAKAPGCVAVRDSKSPDGPVLVVGAGEWHAFLAELTR
ncbi:hypothetical protein Sme01_74400 [Sphaerisporangium melleum]|uniref:DUF397 domain-containing protein n=3 Tax=Sphaerisporangium melleum TaxID=321316 RepID=A0A917VW69_9ACTN|nr:hypothetical protein GCM10007964_73910 [Sphaerisporangium melleum]GII74964.1 hypothetical protein Sme01_74400 [Sphaerisporangium melleum]